MMHNFISAREVLNEVGLVRAAALNTYNYFGKKDGAPSLAGAAFLPHGTFVNAQFPLILHTVAIVHFRRV
jgi:hypothetical protein